MKATELAKFLQLLEMYALSDNYTFESVALERSYNDTRNVFSSEFTRTIHVRKGLYLWIWADTTEDLNAISRAVKKVFGVDYIPYYFERVNETYHYIMRIED